MLNYSVAELRNRRYGFDTDIQFRAAFNVGYPEPKMLPSKNKLLLELG